VSSRDCQVLAQVSIGALGEAVEEMFSFVVVTPLALARLSLPRWGSATFITDEFSWVEVDRAIDRVLARCRRATWLEVSAALSQHMSYEFDDYQQKL